MLKVANLPTLLSALLVLLLVLSVAAGWVLLRKAQQRIERWENPAIAARSAHGPPGTRVVFLGASVTQMWNLERYFPEYETINAGMGWNLAGQELLRFDVDVIDRDPDIVVIKPCAINFGASWRGVLEPVDPARVRGALAMMVDLARAHSIEPVLCTPVPVGEDYASHHAKFELEKNVVELSRWIREFGAEHGVEVADFHQELSGDDGFMRSEFRRDGLHVNEQGYDAMADVLAPVLSRVAGRIHGKGASL